MGMQILFFALSIAGILYGAVVNSIGSGSRFYLVWYFLSAISLGLAAMTRFHVWRKLPRLAVLAAGLVLALLVIVLGICLHRIISGAHDQPVEEADCLIVLGAQILQDGSPSVSLRYRLDAAADYLQEHPDTRCIVSGGQGSNEPVSEAEGMLVYLTEKGIDPGRITCEDQSTSTAENIRFSMQHLDAQNDRVGIVTNDFHMYRALMLARREGIQHTEGIAAKSNPVFLPNNVLREVCGIIKDTLVS